MFKLDTGAPKMTSLHLNIKSRHLLFKGIQKLHVDLQLLSQLFKSPGPVLVLSVPVLNGLTQPLANNGNLVCDIACLLWKNGILR